jgi:DNA-binding MarR family transcriptional regulator
MAHQMPDNKNANVEWLRHVLLSSVRDKRPDLSMRQLAILLLTHSSEVPPGVKELTALLQIPKPSITRAIDRLQYVQLVTRRTSLKDRRQVTIHLVPGGVEYWQQIKKWLDKALVSIVPGG